MSTSMTKGSPLKLMLQFALPLLMGNLLQQTYNIIDAAIVGQILGADALASVGSSSSVQFLVLGFCIGCCAGFGVPVARYFGAGDHRTMRNYIFNGAVLTAIIAAILMIACSLSCGQILHLLSVPDDIFGNAYVYLIVIFIGIPFTLLYNYLSSILRSVGDSPDTFPVPGVFSSPEYFPGSVLYYCFEMGLYGSCDRNDHSTGDQWNSLFLLYKREDAASSPGERKHDRAKGCGKGTSGHGTSDGISVLDHSNREYGHAGGEQWTWKYLCFCFYSGYAY